MLPPPLLALVATHLDVASLLRLQRCSSTQHLLRMDDAWMSVAWRWAVLHLSTSDSRLHKWTLPAAECIECSSFYERRSIPVSLWQAALPVWRAVAARTLLGDKLERQRWYQLINQLVECEQPTRWMLAKRNTAGRWQMIDDNDRELSTDVRRVEVLRDIDWWQLDKRRARTYCDVEVRCRLVLRACPYLQHLHLSIDLSDCVAPSYDDTVALVPRLRSLHLEQCDTGHAKSDSVINIWRLLDGLPHLTSLRCTKLDGHVLSINVLLYIASHSTLEEMHIDGGGLDIENGEWIGRYVEFPVSVEEDKRTMEFNEGLMTHQARANKMRRGDVGEEDTAALEAALIDSQSAASYLRVCGVEEGIACQFITELPRMLPILTRTQPSQHSCEARLALAEWLHRRLRRGGLYISKKHYQTHKSMLLCYRMQVAALRCILRRQLSELVAAPATATAPASENLTVPFFAGAMQLEQGAAG